MNTTVWYPWEVRSRTFSVRWMSTPEADTLDELIADCAAIPATLTTDPTALPLPRAAAAWTVDDACLAQVVDLDEYV